MNEPQPIEAANQPAAGPEPGFMVWLGLGGNLGDRLATLNAALALLAEDVHPLVRSSIYQTAPWGDLDQPAFLNLVAGGRTTLSPTSLLARCKAIEQQLGRTPTRHWGPRVVDVDLLAYGDLVLHTPELQLPHPQLHRRGFVLVPLTEVAPEWRHPILDQTAAQMLAALPASETSGIVRHEA